MTETYLEKECHKEELKSKTIFSEKIKKYTELKADRENSKLFLVNQKTEIENLIKTFKCTYCSLNRTLCTVRHQRKGLVARVRTVDYCGSPKQLMLKTSFG